MFNVCPGCGEYRADKEIDATGAFAVCPACRHRHRFVRAPLFILTGASGAGKSSAALVLADRFKDVVVMESDILWRDEFNRPDADYRNYREMWLRVCKNISQAGKPVVFCGCAVPEQFERCVERRYFSSLHYLALVCDDEKLAARLRARPAWRGTFHDEYIQEHLAFNEWLKNNAEKTQPPMTLLDTSAINETETAEAIIEWIIRHRDTK